MTIEEAIDVMMADGERPTVRRIRDVLVEHDGAAPSHREITPALRAWRQRRVRRDERAVVRLLDAYKRLDAEQRALFRQRLLDP